MKKITIGLNCREGFLFPKWSLMVGTFEVKFGENFLFSQIMNKIVKTRHMISIQKRIFVYSLRTVIHHGTFMPLVTCH